VLFGGAALGSNFLGDTWRLQGGNWTPLPSGRGPAARSDAAFSDDPADASLILFGGTNGTLFSDTWSFRAGNWTQLQPPQSPRSLDGDRLAFDATDGYLVTYGGWTGSAPLNQTWAFRAAPSGLVWQTASSIVVPGGRSSAALGFDPSDGLVVLFGGQGGAALGDTWLYRAGQWIQAHPALSPSNRYGASLAYDPSLGGLVLFGGTNGSTLFNDTWLYRGNAWTQIRSPTSPPARAYASFAEDPADAGLVLFGGEIVNATVSPPQLSYTNDTWLFRHSGWVRLSVGSVAPPPRGPAQFASDPASGNLVLFSGYEGTTGIGGGINSYLANDTWVFHRDSWTNHSTVGVGSPPPRTGGGFVFDPALGGLVLIGGAGASNALTDVWEYRGGIWSLWCAICAPALPAYDPAVFDPVLGAVLEFAAYTLPPAGQSGRIVTSVAFGPVPFVQPTTVPSGGTDVGLPAFAVAWRGGGIPDWNLTWTLPNGSIVRGDQARLVSPTAGTYSFGATLHYGGNLSIAGTGILQVHDLPQINLGIAAIAVAVHAPLTITMNVTGGTPPMTSTYRNLPSGCSSPAGLNLSCRPSLPGAFAVLVTVTDAVGGNSSATVLVNVWSAPVKAAASPSRAWIPFAVIGGFVLLVVVALWYRRRERIRRRERAEARRKKAVGIGGSPIAGPGNDPARAPPRRPSSDG
jgi:hypothetical protein